MSRQHACGYSQQRSKIYFHVSNECNQKNVNQWRKSWDSQLLTLFNFFKRLYATAALVEGRKDSTKVTILNRKSFGIYQISCVMLRQSKESTFTTIKVALFCFLCSAVWLDMKYLSMSSSFLSNLTFARRVAVVMRHAN